METENNEQYQGVSSLEDNQRVVADDISLISITLQQHIDATIELNEAVDICKNRLQNIENNLGSEDKVYIDTVSAFVINFIKINRLRTERVRMINLMSRYLNEAGGVDALRNIEMSYNEILGEVYKIEPIDMPPKEQRELLNFKNELQDYISRNNERIIQLEQKQKSYGCYIATMAYGDYDHPQVLELRRFRDDFLANTIAGRMFIKTYYFISPKLVELLKNHKSVNKLIRKALNQFIKVIKK